MKTVSDDKKCLQWIVLGTLSVKCFKLSLVITLLSCTCSYKDCNVACSDIVKLTLHLIFCLAAPSGKRVKSKLRQVSKELVEVEYVPKEAGMSI